MIITPVEKAVKQRKKKKVSPLQVRINMVTRIIAILVAFASTYFFIIKILFL